ncbi:hypothetical protein C0416_02430 [bacterium]|nr:hypothetical protein [bacterium]
MIEASQPKLVRPKVNKIFITTLVFIFINIALSALLTYDFYINSLGLEGITNSQYALLGGIPHALIGVVFYTLLFIAIIGVMTRIPFHKMLKFLRPQMVLDIFRWISYVGALYAFYLSYAEISILKVYSPLYLVQQLLIFVILGMQIWANIVISEGKKETQVCEFC